MNDLLLFAVDDDLEISTICGLTSYLNYQKRTVAYHKVRKSLMVEPRVNFLRI